MLLQGEPMENSGGWPVSSAEEVVLLSWFSNCASWVLGEDGKELNFRVWPLTWLQSEYFPRYSHFPTGMFFLLIGENLSIQRLLNCVLCVLHILSPGLPFVSYHCYLHIFRLSHQKFFCYQTCLIKIWIASWICMSFFFRDHAKLLCTIPLLVYVPKLALP